MNDVVPPNARTILRDLGVVMHVPALMALVSVPVALATGERHALLPLLATALVAGLAGQALYRAFRTARRMQLRDAMVTAVLSWTLVPLIGVLPFLLTAGQLAGLGAAPEAALVLGSFTNALFESVSGFTSTGLTMVERPSELPATLQWWRSFSQWVGGVGVIVLMLSVFHPSADAYRLYFSEGRTETLAADLGETVRTIWWIYVLYTALAVALLGLSGANWWEALNHGMTGIATGGFSVTDRSLADAGRETRLAMMAIVVVGAISFQVHFRALRALRPAALWRSVQCRALAALLVAGTVVLAAENWWYLGTPAWLDSAFQWTSALTTAGFSTAPVETWSPTAHVLLALAMACGGMAGSTTGGLKLNRVLRIVEGTYARVRGVALHPWRLMEHKPLADEDEERHAARLLEAATIMALLWCTFLVLGTLALIHAVDPATPIDRALLEVSSALGNVGLSAGITSVELPVHGKLALTGLMWLGRLEIIPVLVVLAAFVVRAGARR